MQLNKEKAAGQIIAFSGTASAYTVKASLCADSCLGVLHQVYSISNDSLYLPFQFNRPDDTREAFVLSNSGTGITVISASGWLDDLKINKKAQTLEVVPGGTATIIIRFPVDLVLEPSVNVQHAEAIQTGLNYYIIGLNDKLVTTLKWKEKKTEPSAGSF